MADASREAKGPSYPQGLSEKDREVAQACRDHKMARQRPTALVRMLPCGLFSESQPDCSSNGAQHDGHVVQALQELSNQEKRRRKILEACSCCYGRKSCPLRIRYFASLSSVKWLQCSPATREQGSRVAAKK